MKQQRPSRFSRWQGLADGRLMLNASVAMLAITGAIGGMLAIARNDTTDLHAEPNAAWLSGGNSEHALVVLGAVGSTRPSYGVLIDDLGDSDVVTIGSMAVVHNRVTGKVTRIDSRDGAIRGPSSAGPKPTDDRAALVAAGDSAYLVDVTEQTVIKINADNSATGKITIEGGFSDWVGGSDGRLWMIDKVDGETVSFDGENVTRASLADPDSDLVLSMVGSDPVVLDRTAGKLRWPRRSESIEIGDATHAALQRPGIERNCVAVLFATAVRCFDVKGVVLELPLAADTPEAAELFTSSDTVAVVYPGTDTVIAGSWVAQTSAPAKRLEPSKRLLVATEAVGALLIDDPSSGYAFTVNRTSLIDLEKFSKETIILSADGQAQGGVTASDKASTAQVSGIGGGETATKKDNNGRNDAPQAIPDLASTRVGRTAVIDVVANDVDPEGEPLTITDVTQPNGGGTVQNVDNRLVFVPSDSASGTAVFTYEISDPGGLTSSTDVTVNVIAGEQNTDPVANNDEVTTSQDIPVDIAVLANDTDAESDPLFILPPVGLASHGTAVPDVDGSLIKYTPARGYTGPDSFTYTVSDGAGGTAQATVNVTVTPATGKNQPPVAGNDSVTVIAGSSNSVDVLANDSDPERTSLTVQPLATDETPAGLTLTLLPGGKIDVRADTGVSGIKTFGYTVKDGGGASAQATVTVNVQPPSKNRPPIALDDNVSTSGPPIPINVLGNDRDPDNDPLSIRDFNQPDSGGRVSGPDASGSLRFEMTADAKPGDVVAFTYTIQDPDGLPSTATVRVRIVPESHAGPIANPDSTTIFPGDTAYVKVLSNDTHPDGLPFSLVGTPSYSVGTVTVTPDNGITFKPPDNSVAIYTLRYTIADTNGLQDSTTVTINVVERPVTNGPPVPADDQARTERDQPVVIDVLSNDNDPDNDPLSIDSIGVPDHGTASKSGSQIRFTPDAGYTGPASFTYAVSDGKNPAVTATVVVQVTPPAQIPPNASPDGVTVTQGAAAKSFDPVANDNDPDGPTPRLQLFSADPGITVTQVGSSNVLKFAGSSVGTFQVAYTIIDSDGLTASSTIIVQVIAPPNQPPVAADDFYPSAILPVDQAVVDVLSNDFDPDGGGGGAVQLNDFTQPSSTDGSNPGSVARSGSKLVFTPNHAFAGVATFSYTIVDSSAAVSNSATVSITVNPCPAAPVLTDRVGLTTPLNTYLTTKVFAGGPIPPGTLRVVDPPGQPGTVTITDAAAGKVRYTPPDHFSGTITYQYIVTTACNDPSTGNVTIVVNVPPSATNDSTTTTRNHAVTISVLTNDSAGGDAGDSLTLTRIMPGTEHGGTASIAGGQVVFAPTPGSSADGSFDYEVSDIGGQLATAHVTVTVGNSAPTAVDDPPSAVQPGSSVTLNVAGNDTDPEGDSLTVDTSNGPTVSPSGAGSVSASGGSITFTANSGFGGPAVVSYKAYDGLLTSSNTGHWQINVNQAPNAGPGSGSVREGQTTYVDVTPAFATDPDGDPLTLTDATLTSGNASISFSSDGVITVTSTGGLSQIQISYTVSDGTLTASSTVTIDVSANNAPVAKDYVATINLVLGQTGAGPFNVVFDAFDADNDQLHISGTPFSNDPSITVTTGGGVINVQTDGTATGTFTVTFTVSDDYGGSDTRTLTITVV